MSIEYSDAKDTRRYFSERQAADYLGLSDKTLQRKRCAGDGPQFIKCGGRILYDIQDCDAYMESHKVQSTSEYAAV